MKLYNTLTRRKETFTPLRKKTVGLYTCGPTVYNYAHIGNLRTFIFEDVLERTLVRYGYRVKRVMNITDVGHLTSDADAGEDKLEKGAKREKKSPWDIAKFYTKAFFDDLKELNIKKPQYIEPATKFIPEQIALIEKLFERGFAYETSEAVYFDISRFNDYTKLSRQKLSEKITAAREEVIIDSQKRNPQDFALWFKRVGRFKHHIMHWSSPWGIGFPGWHIECSAISSTLLGQPFDIHTGGVDHIPVHHTNEIAQSEGAYGKPLARYWMHGEFLVINEARMGKSKRNFITLLDVKARGFHPLAYRYFVLGTHYRKKLNFTWDALRAASHALAKLEREVAALESACETARRSKIGRSALGKSLAKQFDAALADDLNTPRTLALLWKTAGETRLTPQEKLSLLLSYDEVLGLGLSHVKKQAPVPVSVMKLVEKRELYRAHKQFTQADALRARIGRLGYVVDDTPLGPSVQGKIPNHKFQIPNKFQ